MLGLQALSWVQNMNDTLIPEDYPPWYKDGLHFQCTGCGKCCSGGPGYVWVTSKEIAAIAGFLNMSVDLFVRRYIRQKENRYALIERKMQNFDCVFLQDKKCLIYPVRPVQCKTFPWWKEQLRSKESWELAARYCEGIKPQAPLVSYEQIQKCLEIASTQSQEKS